MRCPDCEKFVSHEVQAEWDMDPEWDLGVVSGSVRMIMECTDCGTELAETVEEVEVTIEYPEGTTEYEDPEEFEFDTDPEVSDDFIGSDKKGNPYPMRYRKHVYQASAEIRYQFRNREEQTVTLETGQVPSSYFNPL